MEIGARPTDLLGTFSAGDVFGIGRVTVGSVFGIGQITPESFFPAGQPSSAASQKTALVAITAHKREINRIHGYKLELTPADNLRLLDIRTEIQEIDRKVSDGTVREDELEDRQELLDEADEIIGKPVVDIQADDTLSEYAQAVDTLLQPKLDPVTLRRVESLERIKAGYEEALLENPENKTLSAQFQSITTLINNLTPPREVKSLSVSEKRLYDELAELINDHAGVKLQLNSREAIRVAELEASILQLQELAPASLAQPSSFAVARAYVRLL